jgi:ABC-type antimicrobial peptide transport system permease subunit
MDMYAIRILRSQPLRLALTVGGVALCIVLMFFLLAVYRGVADGSVDYIRCNPADFWVLQRSATNILRGSSLVSAAQAEEIQRFPEVGSISQVLLLLATISKEREVRTVFLTGFEPGSAVGGPPRLTAGRSLEGDTEIVLDRSFAAKYRFRLGDRVAIQNSQFTVVGLSEGTNAFVIQYAFVSLRAARDLIGFPGLATCFLVKVRPGTDAAALVLRIRGEWPGLEVYSQRDFLENNIREMKSGFLPLLYTVAAIGAVVLTAILSLLLSVNILERRRDFAVLKTLGSPPAFLWGLVVKQALLIAAASSLAAVALFFPLVRLIENLSPEVSARSSVAQVLAVVAVVGAMSLVSSLFSIRRLRRIYYLEAYS